MQLYRLFSIKQLDNFNVNVIISCCLWIESHHTVLVCWRRCDESSCQEDVNSHAEWCTNNLLLNISETKQPIVDTRKKKAKTHSPVYISGAEVEQLNSSRFLVITHHALVKNAQEKGSTSDWNLGRLILEQDSGQLSRRSNRNHPDWKHHKLAQDRKTTRTSLVPSTEHQWSEMSPQSPKKVTKTHTQLPFFFVCVCVLELG